MKKKITLLVILILGVLVLGCVEQVTPKSGLMEEKTDVNYQPVTTTETPTEYLLVKHSVQTVDKFRDKLWTTDERYIYPKEGSVFLVITINITNVGYSTIKTEWTDWSLSVSIKDNPNTYMNVDMAISALSDVDIEYKGAYIENGGYYKAQVPFEVPKNWKNYKIFYRSAYKKYNIKWQAEK